MAVSLKLKEGDTLYANEIALLTIKDLNKSPFKTEIRVHGVFKCKVEHTHGDYYPEPTKDYLLSLGDKVVTSNNSISIMLTRISTNHENTPVTVRLSCKADKEINFTVE